ncbi:MAG: hypothetical protein F7B61_05405 [Caldisphaeraceae archaeon]|nr:hypothetical protein [Caldisphaeraceae archaeon]
MGVEVAVGMAIVAIAMVIVLGSLAYLILAGYKIETSGLKINIPTEIKISGALLESNNQTLLVNITNVGTEDIYNIKEFDVIVNYNSTNGSQIVELFSYNSTWFPVEIFVGSYSSQYVPPNGILPGETLEIEINLPSPANRSYPIVIVVSPLKGEQAIYTY